MSACLLIGNGLNLCCGGISWEKLLQEIANEYYLQSPESVSESLKYEVLLNSAFNLNRVNKNSKFALDTIAKVDKLNDEYRSLYSKYTSLPMQDILTTNYDYAIERTLEDKFDQGNKKFLKFSNETVISKRRHMEIEGKNIYHIHGELSIPSSICLGTVHYAENLSSIVKDIIEETEGDIRLNPCIFENSNSKKWAELFFNRDIYIVGLSLAECDLDLWWLITYRAKLLSDGDSRIQNRIIYYDTHDTKDTQQNKDKVTCLKELNVVVKSCSIDNGKWKEAYESIADNIRKDFE